MRKASFIFRSISLVALLLYGVPCYPAGQAVQQPPDTSAKSQPAAAPDPCVKSTCRDVPARDTLDTFDLPRKRFDVKWRGLIGGFSQGAGIAGGIQATTADSIPHVQVRANLITSTQLAERFDIGAKFDDNSNRNHVDAWFSYVKRQTDFYGIGPEIPTRIRSSFASDRRSYQATFYRDIRKRWQSGGFVQVTGTRSGLGKNKKIAPITDRFSGDPNVAPDQWIPGFLSTTSILSYGGYIKFDARDRTRGLTRGLDLYLRGASNDGVRPAIGFGDFGWVEGEADIRAYIPILSPKTTLALRSQGQYKNPKGNSQIPFYDLSFLGGRDSVRGFDAYRYRGNNVLIYAAELRRTIRQVTENRGWDVFGFVDSGRLWGDSRSLVDPTVLANQQFKSGPWRTGTGGGLQYRRTQGLAARAEIAHSKSGTLIYTSLSRGF